MTSNVHRFEESIAGRLYQIEVKSVSADRWRAYIVRIPGIPTALMPFYGPTPAAAARERFEGGRVRGVDGWANVYAGTANCGGECERAD